MNKVKSCPYCHQMPRVHSRRERMSRYWENLFEYKLVCEGDKCLKNPETDWCETEGAAIEAWNESS